METKKISEIVKDPISVKDLSKIQGGIGADLPCRDGCYQGICSQKVNTSYCDGGAVCTSGIAG